MDEVIQIDVKFDRKAFDIVLATFSFMHDHWGAPGIVDPAALFVSRRDAAKMISKLKAGDTGADEVTIPMNFDDWVVYGTLLSHTSSNIPQSNPDAYEVLDALYDEVGRLDDAGKAPRRSEG
jgi:hypothetical protein